MSPRPRCSTIIHRRIDGGAITDRALAFQSPQRRGALSGRSGGDARQIRFNETRSSPTIALWSRSQSDHFPRSRLGEASVMAHRSLPKAETERKRSAGRHYTRPYVSAVSLRRQRVIDRLASIQADNEGRHPQRHSGQPGRTRPADIQRRLARPSNETRPRRARATHLDPPAGATAPAHRPEQRVCRKLPIAYMM